MNKIGNLNVIFSHSFNKDHEPETRTVVLNKNGKFISEGIAVADQKSTSSRDMGRKMALKSAFRKANDLTKRQRTAFWEAYRTTMTANPRW
tara:strand:- start:4579 stop:4851 length:273 start_codon:yes stop_codon:yes gene_type:complete